jgi:L-amino acid N-acyltransferase YncA
VGRPAPAGAPVRRGRGAGRRLLGALVASTEAAGIRTIRSGVFPEEVPSLRLHAAAGFRVVGVRERIGRHQWRDVVFLERRQRGGGLLTGVARGV